MNAPRISALFVVLGSGAAACIPARQIELNQPVLMVASDRAGAARDYVDSLRTALVLPAISVAVAVNGRVIWEHASGWADSAVSRPVKPSSVFRVGSVSKLLTAAAAVRLAERGVLDLDRPVREFVPGVPAASPPITSRLLGGHLAGIRHYGRAEFVSRTHYPGVSSSLPRFLDDPLVAAPGTQYVYSSYGYNLLGAVLEKVTGIGFRALVHEEVTLPLGLETTRAADSAEHTAEVHYFVREPQGNLVAAPSVDLSDRWPSGGYVATAADLARFGSALFGNEYLTESGRALLLTPMRTTAGESTGVAFGWRIGADMNGRRIAHHGGEAMGSRAFLVAWPDERIAVSMITNLSFAPIGQKEATRIAALILR